MIVNCIGGCNLNVKHNAKGQCRTCYNRNLRTRKNLENLQIQPK